MGIINTKDLYMQACYRSKDLHPLTEDERNALQEHLLYMYKQIEAVCDKHNLTVMMGYGSALGARRHGGFIPWDDDLDILMPRKDYELLIFKYATELPERFKVFAPNHKNGTIGRFAKIVDTKSKFIGPTTKDNGDERNGIYIDIFPLEYIEDKPFINKIKRYISMAFMYIGTSVGQYKSHNREYKRLMSLTRKASFNYHFRNIIGFIFSFLSYAKWMNIIDSFCKNDKDTEYMSDILCAYKWKPIPKDVFLPATVGQFAKEKVYLPCKIDDYLQETYGDWQRIPPEEERWQHFVKKIEVN